MTDDNALKPTDKAGDICDEALATLNRLRAEVEDLRRWKALDKPITAAMSIVNADVQRMRATIADLTAQRDASISDVVRMGALYDKCAAKDATIADLTAALRRIETHEQHPAWEWQRTVRDIARAALARAQGGKEC